MQRVNWFYKFGTAEEQKWCPCERQGSDPKRKLWLSEVASGINHQYQWLKNSDIK